MTQDGDGWRGNCSSVKRHMRELLELELCERKVHRMNRMVKTAGLQVISDCYECRSLIINSNLAFSQWNAVFNGNRLTQSMNRQRSGIQ